MRLIVGLGNPGKNYHLTRHNYGFLVLDKIVKKGGLMPFRLENQFQAEITQIRGIGEDRVIFAKPQTFMNNSGESIQKIMHYYKIGLDDLIVVCDDLDINLGSVRIRLEGSSGGHKGLESIITSLNDDRFARIRMGIAPVKGKELPAEIYVLEKFKLVEEKKAKCVIDKIADLLLNWSNNADNIQLKEETLNII